MKQWLLIILVVVLMTGCDEPIKLDLNQTPSRVVIEGLVSDVAGRPYVRLTRTNDFYQSGNTQRISDATVTVKDDTGEEVVFAAVTSTDSLGYYRPSDDYVGVINRTYTLTVVVDGSTYTASDKLLPTTVIDSIGYQKNRFRDRDKPSDGKIWELLMYAKEPKDTEDNYLFKFYRNDSLIYTNNTDVYIFNDYGIGESLDGVPSPVFYAPGDRAHVEMFSISRDGYLFYNDLFTVLNSDGGMFSPPPANPRTNVTGGAIGFFQVSSMVTKDVTLKEEPN